MGADGESERKLPARSVSERHFYLMVLSCPACGKGPFDRVSAERSGDELADIWYVRCRSCGIGQRLLFDRTKLLVPDDESAHGELPIVNPTDEPSELLGVGQWLALFYTILHAAAAQSERGEAQRLGYEATLCLDEALKFYPPDSDLPSPEAFRNEESLARFREHPEQFARDRLLRMRQKLPSLQVMRSSLRQARSDGEPPREPRPGWRSWWRRVFPFGGKGPGGSNR